MLTMKVVCWTLGLLTSTTLAVPLESRASPYKQVSNVVGLKRSSADTKLTSSHALHRNRPKGVAQLVETGASFLAQISFGSYTFEGIIDTGSSDTWTVETGYQCLNVSTAQPEDESACGFPTTYTPGSDFKQIPNENFNISYGSGEFLNGILGTVPVTFAQIQIPEQEVAVVNYAGFQSDGVSDGLIGLAYPDLTNAYSGTDPHADEFCGPGQTSGCNQLPYSSIINTIFNVDKLTAPNFALALSRDVSATGNGGLLTVGGVPYLSSPTVNVSSGFASTPIQILPMDNKYRFYLIDIDGIVGAGGIAPPEGSYIVDSGTTLNYFPSDIAAAINAAFDPPGELSPEYGIYVVSCSAIPPELGVAIGGQVFYMNPIDLVLNDGTGDICASGIQSSGTGGLSILGDVFLKNVLAVFDIGNEQMSFASREYYQS